MGERKAARRTKSAPRARTIRRATDRQILEAAFGTAARPAESARTIEKFQVLVAVLEGDGGRAGLVRGRVSRAGGMRRRGAARAGLATPAGRVRLARLLAAVGSSRRLELLAALGDGAVDAETLQQATRLLGGPLYHHINQLRLAGLITSRQRDSYELTRPGRRLLLILAAAEPLLRSRQ